MKIEIKYQKIQGDYEKKLKWLWECVDQKIPRPNFQQAAFQYASCRRQLDREFIKEFSVLKHF